MFRGEPEAAHAGVRRRDFIKTTAMAGVAAALPGTELSSRNAAARTARQPGGTEKKLLCLSDNPEAHESFVGSIRSIPGNGILVSSIRGNYQKPEEIVQAVHGQDMDILLLILPRMTFNFGSLYDALGDLEVPVVVLSTNPGLIPIDANLVASLRGNGARVTFALSREQALERVKLLASPGILENSRAVLYGKPFDSATVPARNLNEDLVYQRTGVRIEYRPIVELASRYKDVDAQAAAKEMQRWKREAKAVIGVPDEVILDACRLYVLLRSTVEKEGLSAVSIDCLSFTLSPKPVLPYPCLAFARLRDEGITAACEADVCGMLSSMFLEEISRKPSFMCNLMTMDGTSSGITVSHCVAPLELNGRDAGPMAYKLHDYHGSGRGVVPEVGFPIGGNVITGGFSKDLRSFVIWPGRIRSQVTDTDKDSTGSGPMRNVCANTMDVEIKDAGRFLQNIPGLHQIMVLGDYTPAIEDALFAMNTRLIGPGDFTPPAA